MARQSLRAFKATAVATAIETAAHSAVDDVDALTEQAATELIRAGPKAFIDVPDGPAL